MDNNGKKYTYNLTDEDFSFCNKEVKCIFWKNTACAGEKCSSDWNLSPWSYCTVTVL